MKYIHSIIYLISKKLFLVTLLSLGISTSSLYAQNYFLSYVIGEDGDDALRFPSAIAIDPSTGNILVGDANAHGVLIFDNFGRIMDRIGRVGEEDGNFGDPRGIAVDNEGNIYVIDRSIGRVQVFDNQGNFLRKFGSAGSANGQFREAEGIAVDRNKNIYVADTQNDRVQVFDSLGIHIRNIGTSGVNDAILDTPSGIWVDENGTIYVSDNATATGGRIRIYDSNGTYQRLFGRDTNPNTIGEKVITPVGLAVDNNGFIYVADQGLDKDENVIRKYTNDGTFIGQVDLSSQDFVQNSAVNPAIFGITVDAQGDVYVMLRNLRRGYKIARNSFPPVGNGTPDVSFPGNILFGIGIDRRVVGNFNIPFYMDFDQGKNLYVGDRDNDRVQFFDQNGNFKEIIAEGDLDAPIGIEYDTTTNLLYVTGGGNSDVSVINSNRIVERSFSGRGSGSDELNAPRATRLGKDGNLIIADRRNDRLQIFNVDGTHIRTIDENVLDEPHGLDVDTTGKVYVSDTKNNQIVIYDESLSRLSTIGGQMLEPEGVAVNQDGSRIFVTDTDNHRVQIYDAAGTLLTQFGAVGHEPGNFERPTGIIVDDEENIYVADQNNHRIQVFTTKALATDVRVSFNSPTELLVTWEDNNSSPNEIGFRVELSTDSINFSQTFNVFSDSTSQVIAGLSPATTYFIRVIVLGVGLDNEFSRVLRVTTPTDGPSNLEANVLSPSSIELTWQDNSNGQAGFLIEYRAESSPTFNQSTNVGANVTNVTISDLNANTRYFFRVRGQGTISQQFTEASAITIDDSPTNLSAIALSATEVQLNWDDNSRNELGFIIQMAEGNTNNFFTVDSIAPESNRYTVRGLLPENLYSFRVGAANEQNVDAFTNITSATTLNHPDGIPETPLDLRIVFVSDTEIDLRWTDNSEDETGFRIFRSMNGLTFDNIAEVTDGSNLYADQLLSPNVLYRYYVLAFNNTGASGASNLVQARTLASAPLVRAPADLIAEAISDLEIELRWEDRSDNEDGFSIERSDRTDDSFIKLADVAAGTTTFVDVNLQRSTLYFYRVRAFQANDFSVYSNQSGALTASDIITALEDVFTSNEATFYPNPGKGTFFLDLAESPNPLSIDRVEVFSNIGEKVWDGKANLLENTLELSLESLPAGLYNVRMSAGDKHIWTKIIKY